MYNPRTAKRIQYFFTVCLDGHWVRQTSEWAENEQDARATIRVRYITEGFNMVVLHLNKS